MNAVGYVRLSRDEDRENYSSIEAQQEIINNYACSRNLTISKIYIDDNYSGYSFDRPAFKEMQEELRNGNVDVIIAKDLSRIGRHNARTQLFLEEVQEQGKRILLPEEGKGYDSHVDDDDIIGIKTWFNERYVKDISRKIKAGMYARQRKGDLIMGNLYGYGKDPLDKSKLRTDANTKEVIELVFRLYIEGKGYKKICGILNERGYMTPSQYVRERHAGLGKVFKNVVSEKWQTHNIQRIIRNDLYIGTLRTHKKQNRRIKGKQEKVPEEKQFVFENHHEPIISREDFELAQQINRKRKAANYKGKAKYDYLFSSFVFCGECGLAASGRNRKRSPKVERAYECTQYAKYGRSRCLCHSVPESKMLFFLKEFLKDIRSQYQECLLSMKLAGKKRDFTLEINKAGKELESSNEKLRALISQKVRDIMKEKDAEDRTIIENSYIVLENNEKKKIRELSKRLEELHRAAGSDMEREMGTAIELYDMIIQKEKPDRKLLELVLDRICIYHDKSIEFKLLVNIDKLALFA